VAGPRRAIGSWWTPGPAWSCGCGLARGRRRGRPAPGREGGKWGWCTPAARAKVQASGQGVVATHEPIIPHCHSQRAEAVRLKAKVLNPEHGKIN
jgi:hypothetical protein